MITLRSSDLSATVLPRGATLSGLWHRSAGRSLVLGSPDAGAYRNELLYAGAIVGPVANRISGAQVRIDGALWGLPENDGDNCLHNGPEGLHARDWSVTEQSRSAVTLATELDHGDAGLPGRRRITVQYALPNPGTLALTITAVTDRPTLMNPAHHPYWTLDGAGLATHRLQVNAGRYLETSDGTLPTGIVLPVEGSDYDFRTPRAVAADRTLDANCCLSDFSLAEPQIAAVLTGGGLCLELATTAPGLQIYNGAAFARSDIRMHPGQHLAPFAGLALEPQYWPDAPAHDGFPDISLHPRTPFAQRTIYRISR